ncbi:MAG: ABC transporter ATP-binding protein [Proteobacteria bacterium]|nr:ABC transporter ATP-binding protein [Pseudomonadota bacterium]
MSLIRVREVSKVYSMGDVEVAALKGISLDVLNGEFTAIMGSSGSGKSTLMNIIGCLDRPTSGSYLLDDDDVAGMNEVELASIRNRKIGFVFQTFNLLSRYTARENVELPLIYAGFRNASERALKALKEVGLAHRATHKPTQLSGGERQRVAIARALVCAPPVILADEPTGNLDTKTGDEIMALFEALNERGTTIIIVTHEHEIAQWCRRVIQIRDGAILSDKLKGEA